MAVTNYLSIDGEVLMESGTTEEERIMYIRDGLGSVVATADSKGNVLNTYMYKPSGAVWQKTGSAPDPRFLWCGTWGYRQTGNSWNSHYVRARHYSHNSGAWTTVDPLWPSEPAYGYVGGRAMSAVDPSGMQVDPYCGKGAPTIHDCRPPDITPDRCCKQEIFCIQNKSKALFFMKLPVSAQKTGVYGEFFLEIYYRLFRSAECGGTIDLRTSVRGTIRATSGLPNHQYWKSWCESGSGPIPPSSHIPGGLWLLTSCKQRAGEPGYVSGNEAYSFEILPEMARVLGCTPSVSRGQFRLHPDSRDSGRGIGTIGCIGIIGELSAAKVRNCLAYAHNFGCSKIPLEVRYARS